MMGRMDPDKTEQGHAPEEAPIPPRNRRERRAAKSSGQSDMRAVKLHQGQRFRRTRYDR